MSKIILIQIIIQIYWEREVWNSEIMNGADRTKSNNYSWYSEDEDEMQAIKEINK